MKLIIESPTRKNISIALRHRGNNISAPYCVHAHNLNLEGYFSGDYFPTLEEAEEDYVERCKREGVHLSEQCSECADKIGGVLKLIRIRFENELKRIRADRRGENTSISPSSHFFNGKGNNFPALICKHCKSLCHLKGSQFCCTKGQSWINFEPALGDTNTFGCKFYDFVSTH